MWIQKELLPRWGGDGGGASTSLTPVGEGPLKEILAQMEAVRSGGKFEQAAALLEKGYQSLSTGRERFQCRLELAKLCLDAGRATPAAHLLDALQEDAERFCLETWEPALCVDMVRTHIHALDLLAREASQKTPEQAKRKEDLRGMLCRIDLTAFLGMKKI